MEVEESEDSGEVWETEELEQAPVAVAPSPAPMPEADGGVTGERFHSSAEAHDANIRPSPTKPSGPDVDKYNATHCPYRS